MQFMHYVKYLLAAVLLACSPAGAQTHSGLPVHVEVPSAPAPFVADGRPRLAYELRITNYAPVPFDLAGIDVLAGGATIASYRDKALDAQLATIGGTPEGMAARTIAAGRTIVAFIDLTLAVGATAPERISHRLSFARKTADGGTIERALSGIEVTVRPAAPTIGAPLKGNFWVAANGLFSTDHRRSYNSVDGRAYLAQRYAIDWVQLGPDGRFFRKDAKANANFHGYDAEVIAVADGVVTAVQDGQPDNEGNNPASSRTVTLDSITGNSVILDLGDGRFALYAHLRPGSIKVTPGERVKAGQLLARLGNSGNSDAPHLHFQLMDANSPLGAEGLPYQLRGYTLLGKLPTLELLDSGKPWMRDKSPPVERRSDFPDDLAVVSFP